MKECTGQVNVKLMLYATQYLRLSSQENQQNQLFQQVPPEYVSLHSSDKAL